MYSSWNQQQVNLFKSNLESFMLLMMIRKTRATVRLQLRDTELLTTEFDQSFALWSLQLVKATLVSDSAYSQVIVGDSV